MHGGGPRGHRPPGPAGCPHPSWPPPPQRPPLPCACAMRHAARGAGAGRGLAPRRAPAAVPPPAARPAAPPPALPPGLQRRRPGAAAGRALPPGVHLQGGAGAAGEDWGKPPLTENGPCPRGAGIRAVGPVSVGPHGVATRSSRLEGVGWARNVLVQSIKFFSHKRSRSCSYRVPEIYFVCFVGVPDPVS